MQRATRQVPGATGLGRKAPAGRRLGESQAEAGEATRTHGPPSQGCRFSPGDETPTQSGPHGPLVGEPAPTLPATRPLPGGTLPTLSGKAVGREPPGPPRTQPARRICSKPQHTWNFHPPKAGSSKVNGKVTPGGTRLPHQVRPVQQRGEGRPVPRPCGHRPLCSASGCGMGHTAPASRSGRGLRAAHQRPQLLASRLNTHARLPRPTHTHAHVHTPAQHPQTHAHAHSPPL